MRSSGLGAGWSILPTLLSIATLVTAQVGQILDRSKLPACAFNCQQLLAAQSLCVPPTAPQADPSVYQTCFCQSNYLANYRQGIATGVCDNECPSASDETAIEQWFTGLCQNGVVVIPNNGVATTQATGTTTAATSTNTAASSGSSTTSGVKHPNWIEIHYRWIIMLIILIIAAIAGTIIGVYFQRRYDRHNALGGHSRDSMLAADEAAQSLRDRHPSSHGTSKGQVNVSQVQLPTWDGSVLMSGGRSRENLASRGTINAPPAVSSMSRGRDRIDGDLEKETGVGLPSRPSQQSLGSSGSRLKKSLRRTDR